MAKWDYDGMLALAVNFYPRTVRLSDESLALLISIISAAEGRWQWQRAGEPLNDAQWDVVDSLVATAAEELMRPLIGWIVPIVTETLPDGWLACDGATYDAADYPELFAVISSVYKSGSTFTVPDLSFRTIIGANVDHPINEAGGEEEHTLLEEELAAHDHDTLPHDHVYSGVVISVELIGADVVPIPSAAGAPLVTSPAGVDVLSAGSSQPHNNMQPYLALPYAIIAR